MAVRYQGGKAVQVPKPYSRELDMIWSQVVRMSTDLLALRQRHASSIATVPGAPQAMEEAQNAIRKAAKVLRTFDE